MLENAFGQLFSRVLRSQGAIVAPYVAGDHGLIGFPDKLVIHSKWTGVVELKGPNTKTREIQRQMMRQIDARWPRHVVQCRMTYANPSQDPVLVTTRYSLRVDEERDVLECKLSELLDKLKEWA